MRQDNVGKLYPVPIGSELLRVFLGSNPVPESDTLSKWPTTNYTHPANQPPICSVLLTDDSYNVLGTALLCLLTDELLLIPTCKLRPLFHSEDLCRRWQM